ncbi:MAG: 4Fe-4S binding protein [Ruminiclostridium sp.]|nr:4Fe-4S binding protein [Ruminiclostridium sp.]
MRHKISGISIFRFAAQVIFLLILPGLFDLTFIGLKHAYLMIISGKPDILQLLPYIVEALIIIPATMLFGRFFCGWFCAFGAFNDFIYAISRKVFGIKLRVSEKLDSFLKCLKYIVLVLIVSIVWTSGSTFFGKLNPWAAFAQISELPAALSQYAAAFLVLLLIAFGAMLVERFFCRYLCPLGAIFTVVSKIKPLKIEKDRSKCKSCRLCTDNCSMGIQLYKMDKVSAGECINCFKCIKNCPRKNPQVTIFNERVNPSFAGAVALSAFLGISIGNVFANTNKVMDNNAGFSTTDKPISIKGKMYKPADNLAPQTDNGTAGGMADSNSQATDTTIPQTAETPAPSENDSANADSTATKADTTTTAKKSMYIDGTYVGVGRGHRSGLKVSVTISNDKITDIQILSSHETPRFSMYVFDTVPQEILQTQSTDVDAVSGATQTSRGVITAVIDALSQAKA